MGDEAKQAKEINGLRQMVEDLQARVDALESGQASTPTDGGTTDGTTDEGTTDGGSQ